VPHRAWDSSRIGAGLSRTPDAKLCIPPD